MMQLSEVQKWIYEFYSKRGWTEYGPFIRVGFLMEEVGEVAQAVRTYEIGRDRPDETEKSLQESRQAIVEELGDVIGNVTLLANIYDISLEEIMEAHQNKLTERFQQEKKD